MRALANQLLTEANSILEASTRLEQKIRAESNGLGIYGDEIITITQRGRNILEANKEPTILLAQKIHSKANEIEELVTLNFGVAVGNTTSSSISGGTENLLSNRQAANSMRIAGREWANSLSPNEQSAINDYTKEYPSYYRNINGVLRGKQSSFDDGNEQRVKQIHSALSKAETPTDMTVYRGGGSSVLGDLSKASDEQLVGSVFVDRGFVSTSMSAGSAFPGDTLLAIHLPAGSCAANIETLSVAGKYEEEVLLDYNQLFYINGVSYDEKGRRIVDVSVIN